MLLYLVDPHVGCLLAILAVAAVLWALVAACLGLWRRVSGSRHAVHGGLPALLCGQPACGCLFTLPPVSTSVQGRDARYRLPVWFYPFSGSETSGGPLYESLLLYAVCRVAGGDTQIVFCRGVVNEASEQSVRSVLACRGNASRSYEQRFPVCVLRRPRPSGSVPELTRRLSFKTCYLVDPASSHMLVSKIKPCMCPDIARIDRLRALSLFYGWWCMAVLSWWSDLSG
ncbi:hypothetical protein FCM35_KLT22206 [Carex littledalei]|uniref:Uncharacterized protein n=1 Tax=Carex littledalei TaxID=544730 RepID=A0A833QJE5_9POAL|nr:hypothetical protein FCM35_KLT22206 [Carex littledalei]